MIQRALDGAKILEYCSMVSGPYCTKLMADLGAEVVKIELPEIGDESRKRGPFPGDDPHPEKSGLFLYLNTNKYGITLDPSTIEGKRIFKDLIKDMDILVVDKTSVEMEKMGLAFGDLRALNPGLIIAALTPFGDSGPYRDYKAREINLSHVSGQGFLLPIPTLDPERPPVKVGGHASDADAGLVAAVGVMGAFFWKGVTGKGQIIDVSKQESMMSVQRVETVTYANDNITMTRTGQIQKRMPGGIMPCKDGYIVTVTPEEHQWTALMELIGDPDWSKEEWCQDIIQRQQHAEKLNNLLVEWMEKHEKDEIFRKGQALSCPVAPVYSSKDIVESKQSEARELFTEMTHPEAGKLRIPTSPYRFSKTPWQLRYPAPLLGQHNEMIYRERLGYTEEELSRLKDNGVI